MPAVLQSEARLVQERVSLVFDFDVYAGNFERPFFAFLTGLPLHPEAGMHGMAAPFAAHALPLTEEQQEALWELRHDHRGWPVYGGIAVTPGFWNDGNGRHFSDQTPPLPGQPRYPAYQSVALFLRGSPAEEVLAPLITHAHQFPAVYESSQWGGKLTLLAVRKVIETVYQQDRTLWRRME